VSAKRTRRRNIPDATVGRLPVYLRALSAMAGEGVVTTSSIALAEATDVNAAKVRKDLSHLAASGTRGVGYDVAYLIHRIRGELGLTQRWPVLIAGVGNLGHALANYKGFDERGFEVVGLIDADPSKVGEEIAGHRIEPLSQLERIVAEHAVAIGMVCTPADVAQDVADRLVAAGVRSILNFAPVLLTLPEGVSVRKVDLSVELQILAFYEQRKEALASLAPGSSVPAERL
jgi:redox-sensing transcriptional repressor